MPQLITLTGPDGVAHAVTPPDQFYSWDQPTQDAFLGQVYAQLGPQPDHSLAGALGSSLERARGYLDSGVAGVGRLVSSPSFMTPADIAAEEDAAKQHLTAASQSYSRDPSLPQSLSDAYQGGHGFLDTSKRVLQDVGMDVAENAAPVAANLGIVAATRGRSLPMQIAGRTALGGADALMNLGGVRDAKSRAGLGNDVNLGDAANAAVQTGVQMLDPAAKAAGMAVGIPARIAQSAVKGALPAAMSDVGADLQGGNLSAGQIASDAGEGAVTGAALQGAGEAVGGVKRAAGAASDAVMSRTAVPQPVDEAHAQAIEAAGKAVDAARAAAKPDATDFQVANAAKKQLVTDLKSSVAAIPDDQLTPQQKLIFGAALDTALRHNNTLLTGDGSLYDRLAQSGAPPEALQPLLTGLQALDVLSGQSFKNQAVGPFKSLGQAYSQYVAPVAALATGGIGPTGLVEAGLGLAAGKSANSLGGHVGGVVDNLLGLSRPALALQRMAARRMLGEATAAGIPNPSAALQNYVAQAASAPPPPAPIVPMPQPGKGGTLKPPTYVPPEDTSVAPRAPLPAPTYTPPPQGPQGAPLAPPPVQAPAQGPVGTPLAAPPVQAPASGPVGQPLAPPPIQAPSGAPVARIPAPPPIVRPASASPLAPPPVQSAALGPQARIPAPPAVQAASSAPQARIPTPPPIAGQATGADLSAMGAPAQPPHISYIARGIKGAPPTHAEINAAIQAAVADGRVSALGQQQMAQGRPINGVDASVIQSYLNQARAAGIGGATGPGPVRDPIRWNAAAANYQNRVVPDTVNAAKAVGIPIEHQTELRNIGRSITTPSGKAAALAALMSKLPPDQQAALAAVVPQGFVNHGYRGP